MSLRLDRERREVEQYLPDDTKFTQIAGRDVWLFRKRTEFGIEFEMAAYYDADEAGYCVQLVRPEIENTWRTPHIGHIFPDGVICFGGRSMRARATLREAFAKSCLWAEGIAAMILAHSLGQPIQFPFSNNNHASEVS